MDKYGLIDYDISIRRLISLFRICVILYIDVEDEIFDTISNIDVIGDGINDANFSLSDHRHYDFPCLTIYWDVDFDNKKVNKIGIANFCKYYMEQINTTIKSESMSLVNSKSDDIGLEFLSKVMLNLICQRKQKNER